jgi:hypothetical protein
MTTTLLEVPVVRPSTAPSQRLRTTMAAMRLSCTWFGVRKSLTTEQKAEAAEAFGADGDVLSAGKRLINTRHPKYKAVTSIRNRAVSLWKSVSLPFPEPGIRLVKQDDIDRIDSRMKTFQGELTQAVAELDEHYWELQSAARQRLGRLYDASDYPASLTGLFAIAWDWPSVEPPPYLRQLSPDLYREECQRVQARFDEAVRLAEAAFVEELAKLVSHLTERLSGSEDGKPKIFRDSAVENLSVFFQRFRELNIGSNEQLDDLVDQARNVVRGVQPQQLRDDGTLRQPERMLSSPLARDGKAVHPGPGSPRRFRYVLQAKSGPV